MQRKGLRVRVWVVGIVATLGLIVAIGYVVLRLVPNWLDQPDGLSDTEKGVERGRIRTAALVFIAGVVAAAGAVFTGLTFHLSRRGQGTDRFNKAIELMGHAETSVRLGGIHALGQLARDDPNRHHRPGIEVLLAYVRDQSPWPPPPPVPTPEQQTATATVPAEVPHAPADVKAAMTVLARRNTAYDPDHLFIDLSNTNLRGIEAPRIHLRGALLDTTQLQEADLTDARLQGAAFVNANLDKAELDKAALDEKTTFEKASLVGTSLRTTKGVDKADFSGAIYDPVTTDWPNGIPPEGAVVEP